METHAKSQRVWEFVSLNFKTLGPRGEKYILGRKIFFTLFSLSWLEQYLVGIDKICILFQKQEEKGGCLYWGLTNSCNFTSRNGQEQLVDIMLNGKRPALIVPPLLCTEIMESITKSENHDLVWKETGLDPEQINLLLSSPDRMYRACRVEFREVTQELIYVPTRCFSPRSFSNSWLNLKEYHHNTQIF